MVTVADSPANVDVLAAAAQKGQKLLGVIVEFDVGQGRTGTPLGRRGRWLWRVG